MMPSAISVKKVYKYFGNFAALRSVDLEAPAGSVLALLGRNGAGKTTLLDILAGHSRPTSGEIAVGEASTHEQLSRSIGFVGHGQRLYDDLTAEENLAFFADLYGVSNAAGRFDEWFERTGLQRFRGSRVSEFSRGMRQRLAIARAFLHNPRILLLDEPWTALDDRAIDFLSQLIEEAHSDGRTIVVCSHQLREALAIATEVAILERGRVAFRGPNTPELKANPETLYERIS